MEKKISFPIFILEIETGDITLYDTVNGLRLFVEEFWDILYEDFRFWDKEGYPVKFDETFLVGNDLGMMITGQSEYKKIKQYLLRFAELNNVHLATDFDELVDIYSFVVGHKMP